MFSFLVLGGASRCGNYLRLHSKDISRLYRRCSSLSLQHLHLSRISTTASCHWKEHTQRFLGYEQNTYSHPNVYLHTSSFCLRKFSSRDANFTTASSQHRRNLLKDDKSSKDNGDEKKGMVTRFVELTKQYWMIAIPVYGLSFSFWFATFYLITKYSGIDFSSWLLFVGFSPESWFVQNMSSRSGAFAATLVLMKLFSPLKYFTAFYGTVLAVRFLRARGIMKPKVSNDTVRAVFRDGAILTRRRLNTQLAGRKRVLAKMRLRMRTFRTGQMSNMTRFRSTQVMAMRSRFTRLRQRQRSRWDSFWSKRRRP